MTKSAVEVARDKYLAVYAAINELVWSLADGPWPIEQTERAVGLLQDAVVLIGASRKEIPSRGARTEA